MRLKLWEQLLLSLLIPVLIASAVLFYAVYNLSAISRKVAFIETADDINLTLLELRRYEKNILLFHEEENLKKFHAYLRELENHVSSGKYRIMGKMKKTRYESLFDNLVTYRQAAESLILSVKMEHRLLEDIRPLGRVIEDGASLREDALEMRRSEKNYIIYREQEAVRQVHAIAGRLVSARPSLRVPVGKYLGAFDSLVRTEEAKAASVEKMRHAAREIETVTMELARQKRASIHETVSSSRKLFMASFIFLIASAAGVGYFFSRSISGTLKETEDSLKRLKSGDFSTVMQMDTGSAPVEVLSFVKQYNQTVNDLRDSRFELEDTLKRLEQTNRELLERQDELVEARKLTAMRLLASEIAHEINNPLSSLITFLGLFYEDVGGDDPNKKETVSLMLKEANRCRAVLGELVDFAKKERLKLKEASPATLIGEAVEVIRRQNEKGISIGLSMEGLPDTASLDPVLFHQAMVNILSNAYEFAPAGGHIAVRANAGPDLLSVTVEDDGPGIPDETVPHIFEPFYTTRKDLGGSGLGLAITKKIMERHGGSIRVESRPGSTIFKMSLPLRGRS